MLKFDAYTVDVYFVAFSTHTQKMKKKRKGNDSNGITRVEFV